MEKYLSILEKAPLFAGIDREALSQLLPCIEAKVVSYQKDEMVILAGAEIKRVGIVLQGSVQILREDFNGNRNLMAQLEQASLFGEVFACAGVEKSPVTVLSDSKSEILFIDFRRIITQCHAACGFHAQLIENMLKLIARKNLYLNEKINCIGRRTTRERIEVFLSAQQTKAGENPFQIPFSREEMADYLCVDRSALSAVLGKLRDEGRIKFSKNRFEIREGFGG